MPRLRVQLLGCLRVEGEFGTLDRSEATRAEEVLCYLLLHRQRHLSREHLAGLLWANVPTGQARKHLRQALWQLQSILESIGGEGAAGILTTDTDWIGLDRSGDIWLDLDAFEQAFLYVRGRPGQNLVAAQAEALRAAVALYHGDLLEGWYHEWCLADRERYHAMHLSMLDKLMASCEAHQAYEEAIDFGARIIGIDPARESTHRRLMRLYYLSGDRTASLRQFERCVEALRDELAVRPAKRTETLYHQIRADLYDQIAASSLVGAEAPAAVLPDVLAHLHQVQASLEDMRQTVQQHILAVELALGQPDKIPDRLSA